MATEQYLITPEMEFTDLDSGEQSRGRMVKSACRLPFVPANGLLYTFPVQCECFPMLRGYMGLAQRPSMPETSRPRLQLGLASGAASAGMANSDQDWPMYRHDCYRSGATPTEIPGDPTKLWEVQLAAVPAGPLGSDWQDNPYVGGPVTPPVCVSNYLLIALPDRHSVVALDPRTGKQRWGYTAGGRVDMPPTVFEDLCLFGARDGYVYCLKLRDGSLAWRFRAAPQETRIAAYGQMESSWPVAGSVLVDNGLAYFAAGRHPMSDGGVWVCALRPRSGELVWEKNITHTGVSNWYSAMLPNSKVKVGVDFEPVDMLVRDGELIGMSRWQFAPETGEMKLVFTNTNYRAFDGLSVPRGLWGYGIRQTKLVFTKPPTVFSNQKVFKATTNDTALLLAGSTLVTATAKGELKLGPGRSIQLDAPAVHDGLIAAGGRLYAATRNGKLYCFGKR